MLARWVLITLVIVGIIIISIGIYEKKKGIIYFGLIPIAICLGQLFFEVGMSLYKG